MLVIDCEPEVALLPDHPPDALQVVAFVLDHVSVELLPEATLVGLAERVSVRVAACTLIVTLRCVVPPAPEHDKPNVVAASNGPTF